MPRLRSRQARHTQWLAVVLAAVTLSIALAIWLYAPPPRPEIQASPLRPWFLVEGANLTLDVRRQSGGTWQNTTGEISVRNVSEDNIVFRVNDGDSYLNLTMSLGESYDTYTTLGAWLQSEYGGIAGGIEVLDYQLELLVLDEPVGRIAALFETATTYMP